MSKISDYVLQRLENGENIEDILERSNNENGQH